MRDRVMTGVGVIYCAPLQPEQYEKWSIEKMRTALIALLLLAVAGCAERPLTTDAVRDRAAAVAIADHECGSSVADYPPPWRVRFEDRSWFLSRGGGGLQISVLASEGSTQGCVIFTR
jgi:hypothetical protein